MIGRLVQEQNIGARCEGARERGSAAFSTGQVRRLLLPVQTELLQEVTRLMRIISRAEPGLDIGERRRSARKIRLLWQIADGRTWLQEACAAVRLDEPGGNLQQGRLPRS